MPDISLRYNPSGEAIVTLVDTETGQQVGGFDWCANVVPTDEGFRILLETLDGKIGEPVGTTSASDPAGAREQAVDALRRKAADEGYTVEALRLNDEQEEPTP